MPYIQLAIEKSKKDWMKAVGKQRFKRSLGEEEGVVLCENEVEWKSIYRREGMNGSAIMGGFGRESGLNLNGEVGGVL